MTQTWTFLMYRYNFYVNPIQRNQEKKSSWKKYSQCIHDMFHFEKKSKQQIHNFQDHTHEENKVFYKFILPLFLIVSHSSISWVILHTNIRTHALTQAPQVYRSQRHIKIKPHWGHQNKTCNIPILFTLHAFSEHVTGSLTIIVPTTHW